MEALGVVVRTPSYGPSVTRSIKAKATDLRAGRPPRVLDLFSGCGGLFLGFHKTGCVSVGGVEIDPAAAASYATNFHPDAPTPDEGPYAEARDITEVAPSQVMQDLGHEHPDQAVDIIVGGPPCPAFTRVGRAKLREVNQHPEAFKHDPRAQLYVPYMRFVEDLRPVAVLMENVPDILNYGGHNLGEEIAEALQPLGYTCSYTLLNAANYGVPQMRERFFLVGIHQDAGMNDFVFPAPTREVVFPRGYEGSRAVALKNLLAVDYEVDIFGGRSRYVQPPTSTGLLPGPVTAEEAILDLPALTLHLSGNDRRGARRFDVPLSYLEGRDSAYTMEMKTWPGFEAGESIFDHVTRSLSQRDYRLFRLMSEGDDYPKAHALAERLFASELRKAQRETQGMKPSSSAYKRLRKSFVPPYDPGKFPNKWRKMARSEPARTLMAHIGKDTYSHIHYDSDQARTISVREAARLQSFPDGFVFRGTMNPAFRQIGNSVPPLLSWPLALSLLQSLGVQEAHARVKVAQ